MATSDPLAKVSETEVPEFPSNGVIRIDKPKPSSSLKHLGPLLSVAQFLTLTTYLGLLTQSALRASKSANTTFSSPVLLAVAQILDYVGNLTDHLLALASQFITKGNPRPLLRLLGDDVPGVDVLITTCGEHIDVVLDTILATCALDYPLDKFRVIVADDGGSENLKSRVTELSPRFPNLMYFNRPKSAEKHHGFKAGNINGVLRIVEELPEGPNPWVAVLDADMIPDSCMLRALMAHAVIDETVGLVTLPQDFYNIPLNDPLHQNMILQHEQDQGGRDKIGAAWCPGTGFVFRRAAWMSVGGFPEFTICEDVLFGWFLNGSAWKTVHVNERLQSGLQPDCFAGHIKQRRKWWVGGIRNAKHLKFGVKHPKLTQLTLLQHLAIINQCPKAFTGTVLKAFAWILVITCLCRGDAIIAPTTPHDVERILAVFLLLSVLTRVSEYLGARAHGLPNLRRRQEAALWQGLHLTKAVVQELLPKSFGGSKIGFAVTGSSKAVEDVKERDAAVRRGPIRRLMALHSLEGVLYHLCFFVVITTLVVFNVWDNIQSSHATTHRRAGSVWYHLLTSTLFPGLRLELMLAFLAPVKYVLLPPTMGPRRQYMLSDSETGGWRPRPESRGAKFTKNCVLMEIPYLAATAWAAFSWWVVSHHQV